MDCYVFLCRYFVVNEESDYSDEEENGTENEIDEDEIRSVSFFKATFCTY